MKNISTHVAIAVVSLVLVIASAFLMTAPEAGMRLIGEYVTLFWAVLYKAVVKKRSIRLIFPG